MPAVWRATKVIPGGPHGGDQPRRSLHPTAKCSMLIGEGGLSAYVKAERYVMKAVH